MSDHPVDGDAIAATHDGHGIFSADETAVLTEFFSRTGGRQPSRSGVVALPALIEERAELAEKVAAIALHAIQERLPQWSASRPDGTVVFSRMLKRAPLRRVVVVPRHLLTINWADSGPGFSWPEAYNAAFIPGSDRYVVTASRDSEDMWGCCDNAIGWFDAHTDWKKSAMTIVRAWWRMQRESNEQQRWVEVLDGGGIGEADARALRKAIWRKVDPG